MSLNSNLKIEDEITIRLPIRKIFGKYSQFLWTLRYQLNGLSNCNFDFKFAIYFEIFMFINLFLIIPEAFFVLVSDINDDFAIGREKINLCHINSFICWNHVAQKLIFQLPANFVLSLMLGGRVFWG